MADKGYYSWLTAKPGNASMLFVVGACFKAAGAFDTWTVVFNKPVPAGMSVALAMRWPERAPNPVRTSSKMGIELTHMEFDISGALLIGMTALAGRVRWRWYSGHTAIYPPAAIVILARFSGQPYVVCSPIMLRATMPALEEAGCF